MTRRILIVIGTRPEAIKLFPVVRMLKSRRDVETVVCVTAQHRELLDQVLEFSDIVPDHDLDLMRPGQSLDDISAAILRRVGQVVDEVCPDHVVVQGDTTTAMMSSLAAFYRRVPVAHVEAGLRSFDLYSPWPEEANRKIIAQIARHHFAPTQRAADALQREGADPRHIHVTGNTVVDALHIARAKVAAHPTALSEDLANENKANIRSILVTCHRRENFGEGVDSIASALLDVASRGDARILFPVHPNPQVSRIFRERLDHPRIRLLPPLGYADFVSILDRVDFVLTDSGGVQEEAPALGKPVLVMRDTTERPEAVEAGTARLVGTDRARIVAETARLLDDAVHYRSMSTAHNPFGDGLASRRIVGVLLDAQ